MSAELLDSARRSAEQGDLQQAVAICEKVLKANPDDTQALRLLASSLIVCGDLARAAPFYERLLRHQPKDVEALANLGVIRLELGRPDQALPNLAKAVALRPELAFLQLNLSNALLALDRNEEGLVASDAALRADPGMAQAHNNRGSALKRLGRPEAAIECFREALQQDPDCGPALNNLGIALADKGDWTSAIGMLRKAVSSSPGNLEAVASLGRCLIEVGEFDQAMQAFHQVLKQSPDSISICHDMAIVLLRRGNTRDAESLLEELASRDPKDVEVSLDLAVLYSLNKKPAQALALLGRLEDVGVLPEKAAPVRLEAQMELCDWRNLDALRDSVRALVSEDGGSATPLTVMRHLDDPILQRRAAEAYSTAFVKSAAPALARGGARRPGPLRIAYISSDFGNHPVGQSIVELFERHDRQIVEVHGLSISRRPESLMSRRLQAACDRFHDVTGEPDAAIVNLLREVDVDIAVDLGGLTHGARPAILASRPARVQISYLGFPGTMGCSWIDYLIGDAHSLPDELAPLFSEQLVQLPVSFFPSDTTQVVDRRATRQEYGLPTDRQVLMAPVSVKRLLPEMFDCWMRILQRTPAAVLCLSGEEGLRDRLRQRAAERGIDPGRLIFLEPLPERAAYLGRLSAADVGLDLAPYGGHSTMRDALWAGLPMVTLEGRSFAARVGASLLRRCGLDAWVANSLAGYEELAVCALNDAGFAAAARAVLAAPKNLSLFDMQGLARNLERAFELMINRWEAGLAPSPISPQLLI